MTRSRVRTVSRAALFVAAVLAVAAVSAQAYPPPAQPTPGPAPGSTPGGVAAVALWVETPGTMILADRAEGPTKEIVLTGVRHEVVAAQLGVRATQDTFTACAFEWTALKGPGGREVAKDNVTLFRAADIDVVSLSRENKCKDPLRARPKGLFPDALVPLVLRDGTNVANAFKLQKDKTLSFWVDIAIPGGAAGAAPGTYTGSITLKAEGKSLTIPVKLTVPDIEIPADSSIPSMYNLRLDARDASANVENYVALVMAHRLQPTSYHYMDMPQNVLDKFNPDGRGYVSVMVSDTAKLPSAKMDRLKAITAHLKERKLFERSYLQLKDEPRPDAFPGMIEVAKQILQEVPEWKGKIADTLSSKEGTELDQYVTCHVKPLRNYGPWSWTPYDGREQWDQRRAAGQQLWFYVSNNQGTPYPTFDVNTPTVAFEPRIMAWAWWYEKAVGHLYWDLMDVPGWKLNPRFPPGDGQLMYPGDFSLPGAPDWVLVKDIKEPVISRRMKTFRQGLQEWELLKLAEKKVGRDKVQAIVAPIYTCMGGKDYNPAKPMWSYDEAAWDQARAAVLQLLEARP